jgi:polyphosphate kinase 2
MRDLDEYLADAFEYLDEPHDIPGAEPVDTTRPVPDELRRRLFTHQVYPYASRIGIKDYYTQKYALQVELVKLQNWIKDEQRKLLVVFEGRDAAGKGSTIKRFMEHLNPRGARVIALDRPTESEQGQWYFQRHLRHLPGPGEIVLFDRSWYNRPGVERVMGFCTDAQLEEFFAQVPALEHMLVRSGVHVVKFYFSVSREQQHHRFDQRRTDPLKAWKLSPMDIASEARWEEYTAAKEEMFRRSHTAAAPWTVIKSDDKMRARLEAIRHVLAQFDYTDRAPDLAAPDPLLVAAVNEIYPEIAP